MGSGHTPALQLANEHRNAYGLRYNDFQRYRSVFCPHFARCLIRTQHRKHCANRTHRLRSTLKMTHGKGRNFQKLPTLSKDTVKDGQYVLHFSPPDIHLNPDLNPIASNFSSLKPRERGHMHKNCRRILSDHPTRIGPAH